MITSHSNKTPNPVKGYREGTRLRMKQKIIKKPFSHQQKRLKPFLFPAKSLPFVLSVSNDNAEINNFQLKGVNVKNFEQKKCSPRSEHPFKNQCVGSYITFTVLLGKGRNDE